MAHTSLAQWVAETHWLAGQTHEEVFTIRGILQELSALLQHLVNTFQDFSTQATQIAELTEPVPTTMTELTETSQASWATLNHIRQQIFNMDTHITRLRGELLKLQQFVGLQTSYVEDGDLCLALNTILTCLLHLATAEQINELQHQLSQVSTPASSLSPFCLPHSAWSLSPLPMSTLQAPFPLHTSSAPPPSQTPEDGKITNENELPATILPYDASLTPWANPKVTWTNLHII